MSTAGTGGARVTAVCLQLNEHGYYTWPVKASGQRRGAKRALTLHRPAGDILAYHVSRTHLIVEVGGVSKRLEPTFTELRAMLPPGFAPLVVRCVKRKWLFYTDEDNRFARLADALAHL